MPDRHAVYLLTLFLALSPGSSLAQEPSARRTQSLEKGMKSPPAKLADFAWLQGGWQGTGLGAAVEEVWSAPRAGCMVGMCRVVRGDRPVFFELITVTEDNGSLVMHLKHFHPDLKGWEERDQVLHFPLVKLEAGSAWFDGITYRKEADGTLRAWVLIHGKDGRVREELFQFQPMKGS
jgi:hypothetical protein